MTMWMMIKMKSIDISTQKFRFQAKILYCVGGENTRRYFQGFHYWQNVYLEFLQVRQHRNVFLARQAEFWTTEDNH